MGAVVVQVSTDRDDVFVSLEEDVLREIAGRLKGAERGSADSALLKRMREDFWEAASSVKVSRTSECDYELVLDGQEDEDSWGELLDAWAGYDETPSIEN